MAAWVNAASTSAYAAHIAEEAYKAAAETAEAHLAAHNVSTTANAAILADNAAELARIAASAGAIAHAAAALAARNMYPLDSVSDPYYPSFAAYSTHKLNSYFAKQNEKLSELINEYCK